MIKHLLNAFLVIAVLSVAALAQTFGGGFYRLTSASQGDGKSLDIFNDGVFNDTTRLAMTGNYAGQYWKLTPLAGGYFRLTTRWQGEGRSLAAVGDELRLVDSSNDASQFWRIAPAGGGLYRITNKLLGAGKSLDIVVAGGKDQLRMTATAAASSGQNWKIAAIDESFGSGATDRREMTEFRYSGFKVGIDPALGKTAEGRAALRVLELKLAEIVGLVGAARSDQLRTIPIWVEYLHHDDGAMWYHPSRGWLVANGYPASLEKSAEIKNVRNFVAWQGDQPMMVLHELAHAYHDLFIPTSRPAVTEAFNRAVASGKYESVGYVRGGTRRHYALNNENEYFAELTEAYFGRNDFYPYTRADLKTFDPFGYEVIRAAWTQ